MAKARTFQAGILNIVTQPDHSPEGYLELFKLAYGLKRKIRLEGDRMGYLGSSFPINSEDPLEGIHGYIYRFTEIEIDGSWLNLLTGAEAEPEEIEKNIHIPNYMKPNFIAIRYAFFPRVHKLVFEHSRYDPTKKKRQSLSHLMAKKFFDKLFSDNVINLRFPDVEVTVLQDAETLEKILSIHHLRKLEIVVKRPNPTDGSIEDEIKRQLEQERISELSQIQKSENEGLKPSERTKALAHVALENGYVKGEGTGKNGEPKNYQTTDHPLTRKGTYYENEPYTIGFDRFAKSLVESKRNN